MNIESNPTSSPGIPMPIPESYQKAIQENSPLLEQLFGINSTVTLTTSITSVNSGDPDVFKTLLHFLDVYIEIFDYSSKQQGQFANSVIKGDSPILQQCITKFREIWRQGFRGFQYLSEKKLEQVWKRAELETMIKLTFKGKGTEIEKSLKEIMLIELDWIRGINDHKRNKDLEVIQMEIVDKFKAAVVMEFPYLFDEGGNGNDWRYCEDGYFEWKMGEIINNCRNSFQAELPFDGEEKEDVLKGVLDNFNAKLEENFGNDLRARNASKKYVIREYMDGLVDKCVENYGSLIKNAVFGEEGENTEVQIETEAILRLHKRFLEESTPKFVIGEKGVQIGTAEYQVKCLNGFNWKVYQVFEKLVGNLSENCERNMSTCFEDTENEIQACLEKVTEIMGRYKGMIGYSNVLRKQFEGGLESIFGPVKEVNRLNKQLILNSTKPVEIQTEDEINYKKIMETCQKIYSDKLLSSLQQSLKYPHLVDSPLLEKNHQNAKTQAINYIRLDNLLAEYRRQELESKFDQFVDHFIVNSKADVKAFIDYISGCLGTSIPFKAVEECDIILRKGDWVPEEVTTNYQSITVMKEYQDKSFEELRLEDKLKKVLPSQKIGKMLEQSLNYFEINEEFKKSLNLHQAKSLPSCSCSRIPRSPEVGSDSTSSSSTRKVSRAIRRFHR